METGNTSGPKPRLFIPALRPFYDWSVPFSYAFIRIVAGLLLIPHGIPKFTRGFEATAASFDGRGYHPGWLVAGLIMFNESVGGALIAAGFLTRLCAASAAIELAVITFGLVPKGFEAYRYTLLWGLILFGIALGGGGPYSLDRKLGREL
jgi:putative oxidoreductase